MSSTTLAHMQRKEDRYQNILRPRVLATKVRLWKDRDRSFQEEKMVSKVQRQEPQSASSLMLESVEPIMVILVFDQSRATGRSEREVYILTKRPMRLSDIELGPQCQFVTFKHRTSLNAASDMTTIDISLAYWHNLTQQVGGKG